MPIREGKDSKGHYMRWGHQHKYYFSPGDKASRQRAVAKARAQERAARSHGWKGD